MNRRELIERIRQLEVLVETCSTDGLTGAWNRAAIRDALTAEAVRARRTGVPLSIILADLDGLKAINDENGHNAGDSALVRFVTTVKASIRRYDAIGRWGGDEFVIVLPGIDKRGAEAVAARLGGALGNGDGSASFGVAEVDADGADAALGRADTALYATKRLRRSDTKKLGTEAISHGPSCPREDANNPVPVETEPIHRRRAGVRTGPNRRKNGQRI